MEQKDQEQEQEQDQDQEQEQDQDQEQEQESEDRTHGGVAEPGVIDLFGFDSKSGRVLLVMNEPREWDGTDERLHQVQEKFNAYVSFLLDGEMTEAHPELAGTPARIELRCDHMPDERGVGLLNLIHDQLALQDIGMEVVVKEEGACGSGCGCH